MDVKEFYILAHICISFTGSLLLLAIWYNINKRFRSVLQENDSKKRIDKGLLYLSMAIFIWVISGCWEYFGTLSSSTGVRAFVAAYYREGVSLLSILNDLFLLLALFYSDYAPPFIYKNEKNITKILIAAIITGTLTLLPLPFLGNKKEIHGLTISALPDLLLSTFLAFLLIVSFYRTFLYRGLKVVAIVSVTVIVLILISILPDVFHELYSDFTKDLIKIVAKTSFIAITLVLATSWVIELANTPRPSEMMIKFLDWSLVKLTIPSKGVYEATIEFGSKTTQFTNLMRFATKRKLEKEGPSQSILIGLGGVIKNQSYLTRIIDNINEILNLNEDQKLERKDLFTFVGQGKYRLRMLPENIIIDGTLLKEFLENPENQ
jgi:hypothetical protein